MTSVEDESGISALLDRPIRRRRLVTSGLTVAGGIAAAALLGCGDDEEEQAPQPSAGAAESKSSQPAADPDYIRLAKEDGAPYPYGFAEPAGNPKAGGTPVVGVTWDIATWDPTKSGIYGTVFPTQMAYNRLLGIVSGPKLDKHKIVLEGELARSWEVGPDGLKYTFRLQPNVKFHNVDPINGRAFTARDIVLAYQRAAREGMQVGAFTEVDQFSAPDATTLLITMKSPNPDFLIPLGDQGLPIYPMELLDRGLLETKAIGTGPGIVTEAEKGRFVKFKANSEYWGGKPLLDGIEARIIPDAAARVAAFRAGQIVTAQSLVANKVEADALQKSVPDARITTNPILANGNSYGFFPKDPRFADERVRQALSVGFDRARVAQVVYQGFAKFPEYIGWPFVFEKFPTDDQFGKWHRYDAAEARKLLAAAGQERLSFTMVDSSAYGAARVAESALMVDLYRELGVTMKVESLDYTAYNAQLLGKKWTEAMRVNVPAVAYPNGFFYDGVNSKGAGNRWFIEDARIDELATKQKTELNSKSRQETWKQIWDRMQEKVYRFGPASAFTYEVRDATLRYFRFGGPYFTVGVGFGWGPQFNKGWIDK